MASEADKIVGKKMYHKKYGKVKVIATVDGTRTKVTVIELDRGAGWDENAKRYKGIKRKSGWSRGENYGFGQSHETHFKDLNNEN
jgi:ribonuclease PH